ncbi:MAG: T9SS type A sorting domain-containing protein [Schleiferiaceae bacterium]|nr:T9SS type A sorting domain-containing protein [Schleiferiaceae bacterium]
MKKILTLAAALVASAAFAQVNVTYRVDMSAYISSGQTIDSSGLKFGGTFGNLGARNSADSLMPNWAPGNMNNALYPIGNDVWEMVVTYPDSSIGLQQEYKFVNGNWGDPGIDNEGGDNSTIVTGGCGVQNGNDKNRTLDIPASNITLTFCWESCDQCDGSASLSNPETADVALTVSPNPTTGAVSLEFSARAAGFAGINVVNILGQSVMSFERAVEAGVNTLNADLNVANGTYFVEVTVDGAKSVKRVVVNH